MSLKGLGTALVTPFDQNQNVDFKALEKLVEHNIQGGVDYLVIQGTTGETVTLSKQERIDVFNCIDQVNENRVKLVLGIGGNNTKALIKEYEWFDLNNVYAILSSSPAYNKPTQKGIVAHYEYIAKNTSKPIILYNVPGRTASNLLAQTTLELAQHKQIIAIKEASGNFEQITEIIASKPKDFLVISGDDALTLPLIALGADGVTSVVANAFPGIFSKLVTSALNGDFNTSRDQHFKVRKMIEYLFAENNPAGVKAVLSLLNITSDVVRLPLTSASDQLKKLMKQELSCINS